MPEKQSRKRDQKKLKKPFLNAPEWTLKKGLSKRGKKGGSDHAALGHRNNAGADNEMIEHTDIQ